jgi:hypothetical protein
MTKVEELREMVSSELLHMLADVANREIPTQVAYAEIQKRLAASHAEGVAEGEEGMKKWIRNTQDFIAQGDEVSCTDVHYATCVDNTEQDFAEAQVDLYIVPASLLAPKGLL